MFPACSLPPATSASLKAIVSEGFPPCCPPRITTILSPSARIAMATPFSSSAVRSPKFRATIRMPSASSHARASDCASYDATCLRSSSTSLRAAAWSSCKRSTICNGCPWPCTTPSIRASVSAFSKIRRIAASPATASILRTPAEIALSDIILKKPMFPVFLTCVPPHSSTESPNFTTRTRSPYFSPKRAMAPIALAAFIATSRNSSMGIARRTSIFTVSSTSRSSSAVTR